MSRNGKTGLAPVGGWREGDQQRAWLAYIRVQLRLAYEMNRQLLADSGMSLPDYDVLTALSVADGGRMQVTVLAAHIGWERSRVSHHVRRMSARGLVTCGLSAGGRLWKRRRPGTSILSGGCSSRGCRTAWCGRSARRWKACTPTSSNRARSRRRSTGTRRRTEGARPVAPARAQAAAAPGTAATRASRPHRRRPAALTPAAGE